METMKRLAVILALMAMALLFTGCEVWLFFDDGGGRSAGIDVYADISVIGTTVASDKRMYAEIWIKNGPYAFLKKHEAALGSETLSHRFKDLESGQYKLLVWYDLDGENDRDYGEPGVTTDAFSYLEGAYLQRVLDNESDWGTKTLTDPNS